MTVTAYFPGLRPCVECIHDEAFRKRVGERRSVLTVQCGYCGHNVTGRTWEEAVEKWNGYKVWELVDALEKQRSAK